MQVIGSEGRPAGLRALQQQSSQAGVTVVTTAQQLLDAVEDAGYCTPGSGLAINIEIRNHLDLTTVIPRTNTKHLSEMLSSHSCSLPESIRVRPNTIKYPRFVVFLFFAGYFSTVNQENSQLFQKPEYS